VLALFLKSREHEDSTPKPHFSPKCKTYGVLASNIVVTQQDTAYAAQILDTPRFAIKPDTGVSPGYTHIWPQIDIQR
jgi:hypothetical protein